MSLFYPPYHPISLHRLSFSIFLFISMFLILNFIFQHCDAPAVPHWLLCMGRPEAERFWSSFSTFSSIKGGGVVVHSFLSSLLTAVKWYFLSKLCETVCCSEAFFLLSAGWIDYNRIQNNQTWTTWPQKLSLKVHIFGGKTLPCGWLYPVLTMPW